MRKITIPANETDDLYRIIKLIGGLKMRKITIPVNSFTSLDDVIKELNEALADKELKIRHVGYHKYSFFRGGVEILVDPVKPEKYERPSKFIPNATSQYYCVYKKGGVWAYKFVRKNKKYLASGFATELQAALAYDKHVFQIDGNTLKTNFPERLV